MTPSTCVFISFLFLFLFLFQETRIKQTKDYSLVSNSSWRTARKQDCRQRDGPRSMSCCLRRLRSHTSKSSMPSSAIWASHPDCFKKGYLPLRGLGFFNSEYCWVLLTRDSFWRHKSCNNLSCIWSWKTTPTVLRCQPLENRESFEIVC